MPRATGRRAARLATTVKDGEQHQRLCQTARQRRQELPAWQRESERPLAGLDRFIGHPLPASTPRRRARPPAVPPTAAKSPISPGQDQRTFQAQAAADIARLTQLFKQARDADDLNEARQIRKEVSRIATNRLSGEPRQHLLLLRTDLQTWINNREAAAAHTALRTLRRNAPSINTERAVNGVNRSARSIADSQLRPGTNTMSTWTGWVARRVIDPSRRTTAPFGRHFNARRSLPFSDPAGTGSPSGSAIKRFRASGRVRGGIPAAARRSRSRASNR